jgi:hypothetical protein
MGGYIDMDNIHCPKCGSANYDCFWDTFDYASGFMKRDICCLDCNKTYSLIYSCELRKVADHELPPLNIKHDIDACHDWEVAKTIELAGDISSNDIIRPMPNEILNKITGDGHAS